MSHIMNFVRLIGHLARGQEPLTLPAGTEELCVSLKPLEVPDESADSEEGRFVGGIPVMVPISKASLVVDCANRGTLILIEGYLRPRASPVCQECRGPLLEIVVASVVPFDKAGAGYVDIADDREWSERG